VKVACEAVSRRSPLLARDARDQALEFLGGFCRTIGPM
jgi:hypothetical protein